MRKLVYIFILFAAVSYAAQSQERALPGKYDGYKHLTQFDSTHVYMEESGLSHVYSHRMIQMLNAAGCAANSTIKVDYDPLSAYVEIQRVLVHRAEGNTDTLVWPDRENNYVVYDYVAPARLIYWGASQKMVEVGHLNPGDVLEYYTYRKGYTYALLADDNDPDARYIPPMRGHFYDIVPFWASQPVRNKVYCLNILDSKQLQYHVFNGELTITNEKIADEGRTLYTFSKAEIMPVKREPRALANNDILCKLLLSTSPNWEAKSMWFYGVNEDYGSFVPTPEVQQKVNSLLSSARNEDDSISILTHWVADNIRYAGISMGEGEGYTLHSAEMNFTDRCGVCKDKASMLISMLRAAGFKAYAAMTMAGERIDRIPADQFNHSVCAVQRRNGTFQLLDPTWVPNVRELWSSAEQQQGYLMGLPNGADLMTTPTSAPENHYLRINANTMLDINGTLSGTISITAEGQSDASVRSVFSARQSEWRQNLEAELLRIAPNAEITNIEYTNPDRYLEQPVAITYTFRIPDFATMTPNEAIFIPLSARNFYRRAMSHLNFDTTQTTRTQPFADRCSRLVEIKETITLPYEYTHLHYPHIEGVADPAASFGCGFWLEGNKLTFAESLMFAKRVYDVADWPTFRASVAGQQFMASTPVILTK
ncbi:MAG: DUF3857 domain-containing protein [Bacteroidales bacterium]|nr:DUF3857 domain-containing protein [Bacteroidales bacterium]